MNLVRKNIPWPTPRRLAHWVMAQPDRVWFDSALQSHPRSVQSILCGNPLRQWQWGSGPDGCDEVEEWMKKFSLPAAAGEQGFCGGVLAYLSYEAWPSDLPWSRRSHPHLPAMHFMAVDTGLILDHRTQTAQVFSWGMEQNSGNPNRELARERCEKFAEELLALPEEGKRDGIPPVEVSFPVTRKKYLECIAQIKEAIARGDFYQVNYAHPVEIRGWSDPAEFYLSWRQASPAPQMLFWNLPEGQILSASPEILLQVTADRAASFPIKGTRPRGIDAAQDEKLRQELLQSEKDGAELLMIVDLVRNDLGKVCQLGTVEVPQLKALESFPHIHHLVAEVRGRLAKGTSPLRALQALFPGGSITGAPKRKAMEWIHELEGRPRGIYTGSIGYWSFNGEACFNIAIRSGFFREGSLEYWVGSGIVADSEPEAEYQETLDKLQGLLKGLGNDVRINLP